jgi:hypothetical protein
VRRRDAVMLAREVLESEMFRAAAAVLEGDDAVLLTRLVEFLHLALAQTTVTASTRVRR